MKTILDHGNYQEITQDGLSQDRQQRLVEAKRLEKLSVSDPVQLFVGTKATLDKYRTHAMAIITREIESMAQYGNVPIKWGISDDAFLADRTADYPEGLIYQDLMPEPGYDYMRIGKGYVIIPYVWVWQTETAERLERNWQLEDERQKAKDFKISAIDVKAVQAAVEFFSPTLPNYQLGWPEWKNALPESAKSFGDAIKTLLKIGFITQADFQDLELLEAKTKGLVASLKHGDPMHDIHLKWNLLNFN